MPGVRDRMAYILAGARDTLYSWRSITGSGIDAAGSFLLSHTTLQCPLLVVRLRYIVQKNMNGCHLVARWTRLYKTHGTPYLIDMPGRKERGGPEEGSKWN